MLPRWQPGLFLAALGVVGKVALAGKPSGSEGLSRVGVLRALQEEHRWWEWETSGSKAAELLGQGPSPQPHPVTFQAALFLHEVTKSTAISSLSLKTHHAHGLPMPAVPEPTLL